ncbi:MAG: hypothetical protein ACK5Z2_14745 [Bacteroidota bacterium]|jgi:hypothetical protein
MKKYNDLYVRMSLDDSGTIPRTIFGGTSPDVIPYGDTEVTNPSVFFADNYNQNVAKEYEVGANNLVYVRVKNLGLQATGGEVRLYYALDSQLNDPDTWKNNVIYTQAGDESVVIAPVKANAIGVTDIPFAWKPMEQAPEGNSYNLIAQVITEKHPNPIPDYINSFSEYISANGGMGWLLPKPKPTPPQHLWSTTTAYSQGDTERTMGFTLDCKNIAIGSLVSLRCDTDPNIAIAPTQVTKSSFSVSTETLVAAGFKGNLTFSLENVTNPQMQGSYVKLSVYYLEEQPSGPAKRIVVFTGTTTN